MAQMKSHDLTRREIEILLAIDCLGDNACGVEIKKKLWETAERKVSYGVLYTVLQRLQDRELLNAHDVEYDPDHNELAKKAGRPTGRYFTPSSSGLNTLRQTLRGLNSLRKQGQLANVLEKVFIWLATNCSRHVWILRHL